MAYKVIVKLTLNRIPVGHKLTHLQLNEMRYFAQESVVRYEGVQCHGCRSLPKNDRK